MIKNIFARAFPLVCILAILANCTTSKTATATSGSQGKTLNANGYTPLDKSLLWEISGKGLTQSSYLFGTIHIISKSDFFWPATLQQKIDVAGQATFEIDMDDMTSMGSLMSIMGKAFMKDNLSLRDLLTKDEYALVEKKFNERGLPLAMLDKMKPMLLSTFISMDLDGDGGMGSSKSYEMEIYGKVKEENKESNGLETIEDQLAIFDSIPYKAQAKMLIDGIKSSGHDNDEYAQTVKLYKDQDIETMADISKSDDSEMKGHEDLFLYRRNRNWIPIMSKMMMDKSTFFAVGAGHLGGEKGVINLLRKAGYTVQAIKMIPDTRTSTKKL